MHNTYMSAKILVIDDEAEVRDALRIALADAGFSVIEAMDGGTGLEAAFRDKPDLILLDIGMPLVSGHKVLDELRRDPWGKKVPVILLTNADDATNITHAVGRGSGDYLIKSQMSLKDIATRVKQHLAGYH